MMWEEIEQQISRATDTPFTIERRRSVGGGCINSAFRLDGDTASYFVKTNSAEGLEMFAAEAEGLAAIAATGSVRVPRPICRGVSQGQAWLAMEYIEFGCDGAQMAERLGRQLARMHGERAEGFGWHRDNTIGSTPQRNTPSYDDWPDFWREQRLGPQLTLAARNGFGGALQRKGERLMADLDALFEGHRPQPSLLHGDLWGGNRAADAEGNPVIFDPAVYYGDRETDIAMTELFGGFSPAFHAAYNEAWPLDAGYRQRRELYNLYHILNHANLFGGGYAMQAESMMDRLLSAVR